MAPRMAQLWTVLGTMLVCVTADFTIPGHQRQVTQTLRELLGRWYYPIQLSSIRRDSQAALCAAHSALSLTTQDTWGYTMWDSHGKLPDGYSAGATEARGHVGLCHSVEAQFSGPLSAHIHRYRNNLQSFNISYQHLVRGLQGQYNTSFSGKYCLVNIRSESMNKERPAVGGSSQLLSLMAEQFEHSYASCIPNSCSGLFLQESIGNQHDKDGTVSVTCEGDEELYKFSYGDYAFCLLTVGLVTLVVSAWTLESWSPCDSKEHSKCPSCTPGHRVLRCFSPVENGKRLLSMGCSASGQNFKLLDGLRSLSMFWVILAHRYMFFLLSVSNPQDILKHRHSWQYWWIFNAYPSVDTFLFISAFLVSVFLKDRVKKFSLTGFYLTRYFRLLPAMVYVMLGCMTVLRHLGSNLVWHRIYEGLFGRPCQTHAWANLFFINNLLDSNEMCMGHLWSLAAEWQLYLITPFILVPLYKWRHPVLKVLPLFCATILSILIPAVITILRNLPTTASFPDLMSSTVYYNSYYMLPWCRAGPYCIGLLAGWGYHWLKDTKPAIKKEYFVMGSIFTSIISLMVLLGPCFLSGRGVYWAALYTSLARPAWGVAIAFVVLCTCYGKGGLISWVCEWPIWGPLCRVSYCMFLVSLPLQSFAAARPQKIHYDSITAGYLVAGDLVLSYMVGIALVLLVEAPAARILNLLLLGKLHGKRGKLTDNEKVKNVEVVDENKQPDNVNTQLEQAEVKVEEKIPKIESLNTDDKTYDDSSVPKDLDGNNGIQERRLCRPRRKTGYSGFTERTVYNVSNVTSDIQQVKDINIENEITTPKSDNVNTLIEQAEVKVEEKIPKIESLDTDDKTYDDSSVPKDLDGNNGIQEIRLCRQRRKTGFSGFTERTVYNISNVTSDIQQVKDVNNENEISAAKSIDADNRKDDLSLHTEIPEKSDIKEIQLVRPRRKIGICGLTDRSEKNITNNTSDIHHVEDVIRPETSQCRPRRRVGVTEMPSLLTMIHAQTTSTNDSDRKHPESLDTIKEKLSIDSSPDAAEIAALIKKHSSASSASLDDDDDEDYEIEPKHKTSTMSNSYYKEDMIPVERYIPQAVSLKRRHSLPVLPVRRNSLPWSPLDFIGMSNCGGSAIGTTI